jgi:hypothetical protein
VKAIIIIFAFAATIEAACNREVTHGPQPATVTVNAITGNHRGSDDSSVVRILTTVGDGTKRVCSGTMIGHDMVLTAAHCAVDFGHLPMHIDGQPVVDAEIHPRWWTDEVDLAVLTVDGIGGRRIRGIIDRHPGLEVVDLVGYGMTSFGGPLGTQHSGETEIVEFWGIGDLVLSGESSTCHGDSGGPVLIDGQVAGVISRGFDAECNGDFIAVDAYTFRRWITEGIDEPDRRGGDGPDYDEWSGGCKMARTKGAPTRLISTLLSVI